MSRWGAPSCHRPDAPSAADRAAARRYAEDARLRFEARYERRPSWDVPRPQPVFVDLFAAGEIRAPVLDAGCGTGENALYLAAQGLAVWGVDLALPAIGLARAKARERGLPAARFLLGDALRLDELGMTFATVVDSGLLHAMTDEERTLYLGSVGRVLQPGGRLHVLCFSDAEPGDDGPRRIGEGELCAAFDGPWQLERLEPARFVTNLHAAGAAAWSVTARWR